MHPINDVDALLLLATALASKRRPADLVEVVAATELISREIPHAPKLVEAFHRLSTHGLISEADGGYALTEAAQGIVTGEPKKIEAEERIFLIKDKLSVYTGKPKHPAIELSEAQVEAAILAHQTAVKAVRRTALTPKPKPAEEEKKRTGPGFRLRKPLPPRGRRK